MDKYNHNAVRLARESRGMGQADLAAALGVSQGRVSKWEGGLLAISEEDVSGLSNALGYPSAFFDRANGMADLATSRVYHRSQASLGMKVAKRIDAAANVAGGRIKRLLVHLENDLFRMNYQRMDIDAFESPQVIARNSRANWGMTYGPIPNMVAALESHGGIVALIDFGTTKIDALSLWPLGAVPMFFVNRLISSDRMRFTLAHELGHIVMHEWQSPNAEKEANEFAAEFLMPADEVRLQLRDITLAKAGALKQSWGVSMAAIIKRAADLDVISPARYKSLYVQLSQAGYRKTEPYRLPTEEPQILRRLIEAYRVQLRYSVDDLARYLLGFSDRLADECFPLEDEGKRPKLRVVY